MLDLINKKCEVCEVGALQATEEQIAEYMKALPDWEIIEADDIKRLKRNYKFKNFAQALEFTNKVGALAEAEGHHPVIITTWGRVTLKWWTHKIKGLHLNDFIMAVKCDAAL
jgi:4a-hydroxytetrahydrobiopterin dehydratase